MIRKSVLVTSSDILFLLLDDLCLYPWLYRRIIEVDSQ